MTKSTITRERAEQLANFRGAPVTRQEEQELARIALAAMDSEPVILYRERNPYNGLTTGWQELTENELSFLKENAGENAEFLKLYRHAQPAPERDQVRSEHAEWSQTTFGNVGPVGPLKHLSKEALEAAAEPGDLSEWADMQFLLWDAQRRAGITDEQITQAMIEKLTVNKQREWPEPKDGVPRLHIKAQPAPVVPVVPEGLRLALSNAGIAAPESDEMLFAKSREFIQDLVTWVRDRKPFQPAPVVMDDEKLRALFDAWFASDCSFDLSPEASEADNIAWRESYWYVWQRCRAAMLQAGNSPVIGIDPASGPDRTVEVRYVAPPGYVMVPKEPTQAMCAAFNDSDYGRKSLRERYVAMLAAAQQEVPSGK